jgi:hypothetical protein
MDWYSLAADIAMLIGLSAAVAALVAVIRMRRHAEWLQTPAGWWWRASASIGDERTRQLVMLIGERDGYPIPANRAQRRRWVEHIEREVKLRGGRP